VSRVLFFAGPNRVLFRWANGSGSLLAAIPSPLEGYALNISGSIAGVLVFTLTSFLNLAPCAGFCWPWSRLLWLVRREPTMLPVQRTRRRPDRRRGLVGGTGLHLDTLQQSEGVDAQDGDQGVESPCQAGSNPFSDQCPRVYPDGQRRFFSASAKPVAAGLTEYSETTNLLVHYDLPYQLGRRYDDVLVVGAGTGNDVAAALRHGAQRVDAVEI